MSIPETQTTQFDGTVGQIENNTNKVTALSPSSTDTQYPSAKAVYDLGELKVDKVTGKGLSENDLTDELKTVYDDAAAKKHEHNNTTDVTARKIITADIRYGDNANTNIATKVFYEENNRTYLYYGAPEARMILSSYTKPYVIEAGVEKGNIAYESDIPDVSNKADKSTTLSGYGIENAYTKTEVDSIAGGKVDKLTGKGLSTNDLTNELKAGYDDAVIKKHEHNDTTDVTARKIITSVIRYDDNSGSNIAMKSYSAQSDTTYIYFGSPSARTVIHSKVKPVVFEENVSKGAIAYESDIPDAYTKSEIDGMIGNINTVLASISNGGVE